MADNSANDFNSRLKRISEQRTSGAAGGAGRPKEWAQPPRAQDHSGRGVIAAFVMVGLIPLAAMTAFLLMAEEPVKALAEAEQTSQPTAIQMLFGAQRRDPAPEENAGFAPRVTGRMGYEYGADYAVAATGEAVPVDAIFSVNPAAAENPQTPKVEMFAANADCTLRRPQAGEKLVNVNVFGSFVEAPVRVLQDDVVIDMLTTAAKDVVNEGKSFDDMAIDRGTVSGIDVYVTDTSAPLYLMLQTVSDDMMWTIHAAPGVQIAHVAMIADQTSAVAGNIGDATIEALRTSDYGHTHEQFHSRRTADDYTCMTMPFQKPNEIWGAWEGSKGGNTMDGNLLFGQTNGYDAYAHWYRGVLGQEPDSNQVIAASAPAVLVGPQPAEPLSAVDAAVGTVHLLQADYVISGTAEEREAKTLALYHDLLTAAAGRDPKTVMPPSRVLVADPAAVATEATEPAADGGGLLGLLAGGSILKAPTFTDFGNSSVRLESSVQQSLSFAALLAEGEAMPRDALLPLYALLRTPRATERFCADTLAEFARSCVVEKVAVSDVNDGMLSVRTDFIYEPNYDIGDIASEHADGHNSAFIPSTAPPAAYAEPEGRRAWLAKTLELCALVRAEFGNCAVDVTGFYLDRPASFSGSDTRSGAAMWLSVRGVENQFEESQLQARVDALWRTIR